MNILISAKHIYLAKSNHYMVSVIIPNYNHASYLKRRLDSVLNQSYQDFEVILLDDCSTDNSAEILNSYKNHPKVSHVVLTSENSGSPFKQWARGFELAKGEFIWIAESDDWCETDLLETLVLPLENNSSLALGICQCKLVDSSGNKLYQTKCSENEPEVSGEKFIKKYLFGDTIIVNSGMAVFRKSVLSKTENEYLSFKGAGDWMFWIEIAIHGKVFISDKCLNYCYRHDATHTNKSESTGQDFSEGNRIFNYVLSRLSPTKQEIRLAIKQRIQIYVIQQRKYSSSEIKKKAKRELFSLHNHVLVIYTTYRIKSYLKSVFFCF